MSLNLATILAESTKEHAQKPAIVLGDTVMPYAMVDGYARRFAGALKGLGIKPGQHIALMLPNVPHFTIAYFGAHYAGAPVVPLNVLLTADEIAYHLSDSEAVVLVVWEGFLDQAVAGAARVATCKHVIVARQNPGDASAPEGAISMMKLIADSKPVVDLPDTMPDDTAVILYTSGTTGKPKGAELTHFNMFYNADSACRLMQHSVDTTALVTLPLFHSFGQTVLQNAILAKGGKLVLLPRFDPKAAFELMQKHKVTIFAGVPTMYFALLHFAESSAYDLSSLKYCCSGGSAMPVEVMRAFDDKYKVNIIEGYGLSETSPIASFNVLDKPKKPGSIGVPIDHVELRLVDEQGQVITEANVPGEIQIKGHNVMKGYWSKPEATAEAIKDGWFASGDIAHRDTDGYYFIVDRKKDMIIRGGFNVYPREIEEVLFEHPSVAEAAVVGKPDERLGEEVVAVISLKPGTEATAEEVIAFTKERLAAYKYPREVRIIEDLPKGPTGKILKTELRD